MTTREILLIDLTCVLLDFCNFNLMFLREDLSCELSFFILGVFFVRAIIIFSLGNHEPP